MGNRKMAACRSRSAVCPLHDGDVLLSLGDQDVHVRLAGEFANIDPLIGSFQVSATGRQFMLQGPVDIASRVNGVLSLAWQIDDGRLETPDAVLGGLKGEFLLERTLDHKADIAVNLTLSSDSLRLDQHNLEQFHVELAGLVGMPATLANTTAQAVVELGTSSTPVHGRIAASLAQVSDGPQLTLDLDIDLNDDLTLDDGTGVSIASPSTLSSHIVTALPDAAITEDIDPLGLALTHILDLSAQFRTGGIAIGERFATTSAEGEVVIRLNGDDATATISAPLTVSGLTFDQDWLATLGLPESFATLLTMPSEISVSGDEPWHLSRGPDGEGRINGSGTVSFDHTGVAATITLDGAATILADGTVATAVIRDGRLIAEIEALAGLQGFRIEVDARAVFDGSSLETRANLIGTANEIQIDTVHFSGVEAALPFEATLSGDMGEIKLSPVALLSAEAGQIGDLGTGPIELELPLRIAGMSSSLMIYMDDNGWIDLTGLSHPRFVITEPVSIPIKQNSLPLLSIEFTESGGVIWDSRIKIGTTAVAATIQDDDGVATAHITGTLPSVSAHGTQLIRNYLNLTVETQEGSLIWDEHNIQVSGLRTLMTYNSGLSPWPQLRLDIAEIRDLTSPERVVPLTADLRVAPVWPVGDDVRFSLNVHAPDKRYAVNVEASYEQAKNRAVALVRLPPLVFDPSGYQPKDLSPLSAAYAKDVSGSIEVSGDVTWHDGSFSSDLNLAVRDLSATAFGTRVERLNTLITFDNVMPPSTPPGQLVAIAGVDAGLPLRDALISLALDPEGIVILENATMKFAGGDVTSDLVSWRIGDDPEPIQLHVAGVDVGALFALADMDELTATGTLDGTIPVRFADGDLIIEGASLASREPGELHYLPVDVPTGLGTDDASIDLVLDALSNFHYARLEVELDRAAGGETKIGLHIAGANPDLYDGYPIELNVSLTGALDQIVRDSLAGYRIPDEIRERLSGF